MNSLIYKGVCSLIFLVLMFQACVPAPIYKTVQLTPKTDSNPNTTQVNATLRSGEAPVKTIAGKASYYANKFHGRQTANGEIFDMMKLTAAHKTMPFNTLLDVTNLKNNKTVRVRINDRGPFVGNRIIDLSLAAAQKIEMIKEGVADVELKVIRWGATAK